MSISVDLDALAAEVALRQIGYLITTSEDGRPHTSSHTIEVEDGAEGPLLRCPAGRSATRNTAARPLVTLLWPPTGPDGYSLIVDGEATVSDGVASIVPTSAVLHRPAPADTRSSPPGR